MKTHFHLKVCAPSLALKIRYKTTWKWPDNSNHKVLLYYLRDSFTSAYTHSTHSNRVEMGERRCVGVMWDSITSRFWILLSLNDSMSSLSLGSKMVIDTQPLMEV